MHRSHQHIRGCRPTSKPTALPGIPPGFCRLRMRESDCWPIKLVPGSQAYPTADSFYAWWYRLRSHAPSLRCRWRSEFVPAREPPTRDVADADAIHGFQLLDAFDQDCNQFATSIELPPSKPITRSSLFLRALATACSTTASGGSATTSAHMLTDKLVARRLATGVSTKPVFRKPASVTTSAWPAEGKCWIISRPKFRAAPIHIGCGVRY
jgi:hypothetical protein